MKYSFILPLIAALSAILCADLSANDIQPLFKSDHKAMGWAACSSVLSGDDYEMTGGGEGAMIVLRNDGSDMRRKIYEAILNHDVIVFDGSCGDFVLPANIGFQSVSGKTLIGVNDARLLTEYFVPPEIHKLLDDLDVKSLSSWAEDDLGGTLSNGSHVNEQCELAVRQALIDYYDDQKETYRNSGIFVFNGCSNIIIRNLDLVGPGSIDLGAADLITLNACEHIWIDHCRFTDGMDGNLDIINNSDFITVSDTHFRYTSRSYNHPLSNLTGGILMTDGSAQKNNISWIRCFWDEGCGGRMPWTGYGYHHLLNCYWDCKGGTSIDAHELSKLLIEGCYFTNRVGKALALRTDDITYDIRNSIWNGKTLPQSNGTVELPYSYEVGNLADVPLMAKKTGPTSEIGFSRPLTAFPDEINLGQVYSGSPVEGRFNLSAFGENAPEMVTVSAPEGVLLSADPSGEFLSTITIDAADINLLQADIYYKVTLRQSDNRDISIKVSSGSNAFDIPVRGDVIGLDGEGRTVTIRWPLTDGTTGASEADISFPDAFEQAPINLGEKIFIHSTKYIDGKRFTFFNPNEAISRIYDADCCIMFDIVPSHDYIFIPKKMRLKAARVATDMCYLDIDCSRDGGDPVRLLDCFQPVRSADAPYYSEIELPLSNAGVGDTLQVILYLYYMSANKQLALSDVEIEGEVYEGKASVELTQSDPDDQNAEYFDLSGLRVVNPEGGKIYLRLSGSSKAAKTGLVHR